jgi:hypothetical protein
MLTRCQNEKGHVLKNGYYIVKDIQPLTNPDEMLVDWSSSTALGFPICSIQALGVLSRQLQSFEDVQTEEAKLVMTQTVGDGVCPAYVPVVSYADSLCA